MMTFLFFLAFTLHAKEVAITIDDAPMESTFLQGNKRTQKLIQNLKDVGVDQVVFFCNPERMSRSDGESRIAAYAKAGHIISNHTFNHPDYDKISFDDFRNNFTQADALLKKFPTYVRWFRFPFLHEGNTLEKRDKMREHLKKSGYSNGYVTIDTYDWYMNRLYQNAQKNKKTVNIENLRRTYIKVLIEDSEFFENISVNSLGRSVKHTLLIHENDLAAMFIGDLVKAYRKSGWKIIGPKEAYQDPISKIEPNTLFLGQGRVAAIAKVNGYKGSFWNWDDEDKLDKLFDDEKVFN